MAFKGEEGCLVKDSRWVVHMFVAGLHTLGSPVVAGGIHIHPTTLVNNYR
jgi:hypothetical protein